METIKRADVMDDAAWHQMYERLMDLIAKVSNLGAETFLLQLVDSLVCEHIEEFWCLGTQWRRERKFGGVCSYILFKCRSL